VTTYDSGSYPPVAVTADLVVLTVRDDELAALLVRRGEPPFAGELALPGGFVQPGETLREAAARELTEETGAGFGSVHLEQLASYGDPGRDPRMRVISVAYLAFAPELPEAQPGTDATEAKWAPAGSLGSLQLAFDHARIAADGIERARAKLEYTPLAAAFTRPPFTIAELREVYETVWGEKLHAGNFHRKVLSVPGFVEPTGAQTQSGSARGGPRSRLYQPGPATQLHPPLLRPGAEGSLRA
jgi:8-oxo-dGTP diphosphatase